MTFPFFRRAAAHLLTDSEKRWLSADAAKQRAHRQDNFDRHGILDMRARAGNITDYMRIDLRGTGWGIAPLTTPTVSC